MGLRLDVLILLSLDGLGSALRAQFARIPGAALPLSDGGAGNRLHRMSCVTPPPHSGTIVDVGCPGHYARSLYHYDVAVFLTRQTAVLDIAHLVGMTTPEHLVHEIINRQGSVGRHSSPDRTLPSKDHTEFGVLGFAHIGFQRLTRPGTR